MSRRFSVRILLSLILVALFIAQAGPWMNIQIISSLENIAYDLRLNATRPDTVDDRIVILDLDEKSLSEVGRWPWSRHHMAELLDQLFEHYNIRVIGFDMVFAEADESSGLNVLQTLANGALKDVPEFTQEFQTLRQSLKYDQRFADSLKDRPVIMGYVFNLNSEDKYNILPPSLGEVGDGLHFIQPEGYTGNLEILQKNAAGGGFFDNPRVDEDGIFRRVPLLQSHDGELYESLAMATTRMALGFPEMRIETYSDGGNYQAIESITLGDEYRINVDKNTSVLVPYRGRQGSFPYVSAVDALKQRVDQSALQGKIVLLGTSAPGLLDLRSTPVEKNYPGVEVHANVISGILDNRIKHQPSYTLGVEVLVLLVLGIAMIAITALLSPLWSTAFTLGLMLVTIAFNMLAWEAGLVVPIANTLLLLLGLFILHMSYGFFIESRGKRALAKLFGQYIPPELVDEMSADPTEIVLDGQSREMTVLFSDVRGFTTISEGLDPKELTQLMNSFLTPMTRIIHHHRGTIDKYMGDAVMAFWGAPLDDAYHAKNALYAAFEMIRELDELQQEFQQRGWPEIRIGVGLNTGTMSVGNMGSEFRMAYTALGDAVNLGSRLEGLTKQYGVTLIVSETTAEAVPECDYLELDRVRVKGKSEPVTIYEPIGLSIDLSKEERSEVRRFNKALELYRSQRWDQAEQEIFSLAQSTNTKDRKVYQIYLERIQLFRKEPPPENWDGVFTHTSK
ncbi:adenylate/guanylate cyclase [gamma proteobacterium HTCC5015]|nr:adenylate/guanylate cyclase [gamma proteobacterium HTCC5015]